MNEVIDSRWTQFFAREGLIWPSELALGPSHRVAAMCYLEWEDKILLLRRNRPPFVGCWTAPSGKIERGEDPFEAVKREVFEETHLSILSPKFRMLLLENGPDPYYQWLLFIFVAQRFYGEEQESPEGILRWIDGNKLGNCGMPDIDVIVSKYVFSDSPPMWGVVDFNLDGKMGGYSFNVLEPKHKCISGG